MSYFSNLDTAIQEKKQGRGREAVRVGSIGVCLEDTGLLVKLYKVDTIYAGVDLEVFCLGTDFGPDGLLTDEAIPREVKAVDFWCLV